MTYRHRAAIRAGRKGLVQGTPEWKAEVERGVRYYRLRELVLEALEEAYDIREELTLRNTVANTDRRKQYGRLLTQATDTVEVVDLGTLYTDLLDEPRIHDDTVEHLADLLGVRLPEEH